MFVPAPCATPIQSANLRRIPPTFRREKLGVGILLFEVDYFITKLVIELFHFDIRNLTFTMFS